MIEAVVGVALRAILASVLLGGFLAALVFIATRALALTASTRHALWTTALIATAVMPLAGVSVSVLKGAVLEGSPSQAARAAQVVRGPQTELAMGGSVRHDAARLAPAPRVPSAAKHDAAAKNAAVANVAPSSPLVLPNVFSAERMAFVRWAPRMSRAIAVAVVGIWALGALIGLIGLAASIARVRGLKRRSSPLDGTLADELPWLTEVGPGREIYLRLSYETETPVAIGFRRPVILIPTELATANGLSAIEQLILHEHAHLRRYDDWTNLVQRIIERVFWFNPVVWLVGRRIALEREIASDDAVIEKTGEAHAYATSLWKLAREMRMPEHAVVAPGALLTRKQITVRIEQLLDKKRSRLHRSPAAALGVALASALAVGFVATSAPAVELPAETPVASSPAAAVVAWHAEAHKPIIVKKIVAAPRAHGPHAKGVADDLQTAAKTKSAIVRHEQTIVRYQIATTDPAPGAARDRHVTRMLAQAAPADPVAPPPAAGNPHELPPLPETTLPALPAMPAVPPAPTLSPVVIRKIRIAQAAVVRAHHAADAAGVGADIARAVHDAMAALPREIAQEAGSPARHERFDGVKLSRELVASCTACSFRNADVRGLDLHGLRIRANDFSGADMRGVNLSGAKLVGTSLAGANLTNADLRNAELAGVDLHGALFDGAQLDGIKLVGVSVRHVSLRGTSLRSVLANCTGCDFHGFDLHGQDLHGISLSGADLAHADLHDANLSGVRFSGVDLSYANLSNVDLTNARLVGCNLAGVELRGARTTGMTMQGSGLDG